MNTQTLSVELQPAEGAVLRLIGLVERRGFEVRSINLPASTGSLRLDLGVRARDTARTIETLHRQIKRLSGVCRVSETPFTLTNSQGGGDEQNQHKSA